MRNTLILTFLLATFVTAPALADAGGANLVIPIAGRTVGAFGTQWQTDLVVTNLNPTPANVTITFYPTTGSYSFTSMPIAGWGTIELNDVIRTTLLTEGLGFLRVNSASPGARLTARAYVYNRGNSAGEYGQGIPALPIDVLEREHVISGLAAASNRRTNVGFTNPWPIEAQLIVEMRDATGQLLNTTYPKVAPLSVLQVNDLFPAMGVTNPGAVSLRITSTGPSLYPYASIVRNDTGDAVFVGGSGVKLGNQDLVATRCSDPAALLLAPPANSVGDWIVIFDRTIVNADYVRQVIAPRHGVTVKTMYEHAFVGFLADLTPQQIAALRCEAVVQVIQENARVPLP